jgi:DNA polymerase-3 subunit delta'
MIIGHKRERAFLRRIAENQVPSQAYIFSGPDRIGKFLVAEEFSSLLSDGSSTDVRVIEPEQEEKAGVVKERSLSVEIIRDLKSFLSQYPSSGAYRIAIIRDAHRLTEGAQNALLKTLEDPVSSALVILITHEPGRILGTVRSRCQTVSFAPVEEETIASGIRELFPGGVSVEPFFFTLGRPGLVVAAAREMKTFERKKVLLRQLFQIASIPVSERLSLSEQFGKNVPLGIELCEWYLLGAREQLRKGGEADSIRKKLLFLERMDSVLGILKSTQTNARLAFDTLFLSA